MSIAARPNLHVFAAENAPLVVFTLVYTLTCVLGAFLMLIDYRPFVSLYEIFSGTVAPNPIGSQRQTAVVLLIASPMLLWAGYLATTRIAAHVGPSAHRPDVKAAMSREHGAPNYRRSYVLLFASLAAIAVISLGRSGAFINLAAWLNYAAWIDARWLLFRDMSFLEFVNLYTLVPLSAALVLITTSGASFRLQALRWVPALVAVALALALYQKKAAVVVVAIILSTWAIDAARRDSASVRRGISIGAIVLASLYAAMVVVPTYNAAASVVRTEQRDRPVRITPLPSAPIEPPSASALPSVSPGTTPSISPLDSLDPMAGVLLYSLLSSVTRTSAPALYYPIVYPALHPYYGPDIGQDIICSPRLGCENHGMPDDNLVVWDYMNPTFHGGSIAAPFQFALYSQVGVFGALLGSLVLGALLALIWRVTRGLASSPLSSLVGATALLLSLNLALDSLRNSTVVSYGALWGFVFVAAVAALGRILALAPSAIPSSRQSR